MLGVDVEVGRPYARRLKPQDLYEPLQKVRAVSAPRGRQVKVAHVEGELEGLEEWVPTRTLLCKWGERRAYLKDEERAASLREASVKLRDSVVEAAISAVLTATGEEGGFTLSWDTTVDTARRLWTRARIDRDPTSEPFAYVDRFGTLHLSYESALRFAEAFAAAEPEPCILYVTEWEDRLRAEGFEPGNRHAHGLLREWAPAHALVRQWASANEIDLLKNEIQRLRSVVAMAVRELERAGADDRARRVTRALAAR